MSETEKRNRLENLDKQISPMPDEQKSYLLGFMEGVCQMSEKQLKESVHCEE